MVEHSDRGSRPASTSIKKPAPHRSLADVFLGAGRTTARAASRAGRKGRAPAGHFRSGSRSPCNRLRGSDRAAHLDTPARPQAPATGQIGSDPLGQVVRRRGPPAGRRQGLVLRPRLTCASKQRVAPLPSHPLAAPCPETTCTTRLQRWRSPVSSMPIFIRTGEARCARALDGLPLRLHARPGPSPGLPRGPAPASATCGRLSAPWRC